MTGLTENVRPHVPDFLIIGAAKSGTTSLARYLAEHPEVYIPDTTKMGYEEPSFFAPEEAGGAKSWEEYQSLFADAGEDKICGEKSVAYLYDPDSPSRIKNALGGSIKLIVILRNPVDMAYSLWGHNRRLGIEPLTFKQALMEQQRRRDNAEFSRSANGWSANYQYTTWGRYADQLERYTDVFPRRKIKIYFYEEFFKSGLPEYSDLLAFLGANMDHAPQEKTHNPSGGVRSKWLRSALSERRKWKEPLKAVLPRGSRQVLRKYVAKVNRRQQQLPRLDDPARQELEKLFYEDVRRLERIVDRDVSSIWF